MIFDMYDCLLLALSSVVNRSTQGTTPCKSAQKPVCSELGYEASVAHQWVIKLLLPKKVSNIPVIIDYEISVMLKRTKDVVKPDSGLVLIYALFLFALTQLPAVFMLQVLEIMSRNRCSTALDPELSRVDRHCNV